MAYFNLHCSQSIKMLGFKYFQEISALLLLLIVCSLSKVNSQSVNRTTSISIFPEPLGPFYGAPYSTKVARRFPIPATAYGKCEQGKVYQINSAQDLRKYDAELQCVFSAGQSPSKVPEGPAPGRVLLALNSRHFIINPLVSILWRGNFVFKAECNATSPETKKEIYLSFHNSFNRAYLPGIQYLAPLQGNFAPGEYEDGKVSVVMDFTKDLTKICPDYPDFVERNKSMLPTQVKNLVNLYPQTQVLDVFRLVGRQKDGDKIYLGKTYFKDYYRSDKQLATIAFWYMTSKDGEVNPEFGVGQALPPLEKSFDYMFPGVFDIILRYLPFDNFVSRPIATFWKVVAGGQETARSGWFTYTEYLRHAGRARANRRRLRQYFRTGKVTNTTSPLRDSLVSLARTIRVTSIRTGTRAIPRVTGSTIRTTRATTRATYTTRTTTRATPTTSYTTTPSTTKSPTIPTTTYTTIPTTTKTTTTTPSTTAPEELSEPEIILADFPDLDIRKFIS